MRFLTSVFAIALALFAPSAARLVMAANLQFSIGHADITPVVEGRPAVWMAGYYHGRAATGVHDPLFARAMMLSDGKQKIALVSLDVVGWSYPSTVKIREQLPEIDYVIICSTHNHEGPDTIGIWGESPIKRGSDDRYNARIESTVVGLVQQLNTQLQPVTAEYAKIDRPDLIQDNRLPEVLDPTLRVLRFRSTIDHSYVGLLVQGTSHPESLGPKNTLITADFPGYTIQRLEEHFDCPTVYVSGAIGGLLAPPEEGVFNRQGVAEELGTFAYAQTYGQMIADALATALESSQPIELAPFDIVRQEIAIPIDNPLYRLARSLNVIRRVSYEWTGRPESWGQQVTREYRPERAAAITEVAVIRLGELYLLSIPGELYPELVTGQIPNPAEEHADFPDAPIEPHIAAMVNEKPYILLGLSNDEIGYILPKRQWDRDPPYAYGRGLPQYGEINSCSPDVGPIIMGTLARLWKQAEAAQAKP
ncbi:hypothetical protein AB1L30_23860 [Bremerella sp. JC817]|uniref:neutral/alkaline non-lysosomal ceramidase N-terminal domain-containing protein n=1 Tax=Bremerella sp. JC817 TaxID=3231756 RepID=UPI00345A5BF6